MIIMERIAEHGRTGCRRMRGDIEGRDWHESTRSGLGVPPKVQKKKRQRGQTLWVAIVNILRRGGD